MPSQEPVTQTMKISEVKSKLNRLVNEVYRQETRVLVEKAGIPVAAIVSTEDLNQLARFDRERQAREHRFALLNRMREAFKDVPVEEIERETAKAIAEVRAEMEAERAEEVSTR